jgi:proline iminopeptidase
MVNTYKITKPIKEFYLNVEPNHKNPHKLWVQESGNPNGIPLICLHGGPGYPMTDWFRVLINPKKFRIITFHQRGCGRSTPKSSLIRNKTRFHIEDIEKIRKHLNIDKWIVQGGSWGATLALAYAEAHPDKVKGLILFGLSLFRNKMENVTKYCAPEVYDKWKSNHKTETEAFKSHIKNLKKKRVPNTEYEKELFKIMDFPNIKCPISKKRKLELSRKAKVDPRIGSLFESYYYTNNAFMKKNQLLKNAHRLNKIPGFIIHGRFDIICDPSNSYDLSKHWKNSKLIITSMAGHSMWNVNNAKAIQDAFNFFSK